MAFIKKNLLICFFVASGIFVLANNVLAEWPSLVPTECQGAAMVSECNLDSVKQLIINIVQILLGVSGILALAVFILAGLKLIISQGSPEKRKEAVKMINFAVIGLILVIFSGAIVKIVLNIITGA